MFLKGYPLEDYTKKLKLECAYFLKLIEKGSIVPTNYILQGVY